MKQLQKTLIAGYMAALTLGACTDNPFTYPEPPEWEMDRIQKVANSNQAEITAGNLASGRADSAVVRDFGTRMVMDHTDAQNKLINMTAQLNRIVSPQLDSAHQAQIAYLKTLHGRAFDSAYIHTQVKDHQDAINLLQNIIQNSSTEGLRNYAQQTLPVVQMHYQRADSIAMHVFP